MYFYLDYYRWQFAFIIYIEIWTSLFMPYICCLLISYVWFVLTKLYMHAIIFFPLKSVFSVTTCFSEETFPWISESVHYADAHCKIDHNSSFYLTNPSLFLYLLNLCCKMHCRLYIFPWISTCRVYLSFLMIQMRRSENW